MNFTVTFKSWINNHSDFQTPEHYNTLEEAIDKASKFYSLVVEYIGNNCYVNNGCETQVLDATGNVVWSK